MMIVQEQVWFWPYLFSFCGGLGNSDWTKKGKLTMKTLFDDAFIRENLMGPNALKLLEDMTAGIEPKPGMRVLDLGCGKGLTSMYLADRFGVQVFATDLWISATENHQRFTQMGFESRIIPIHADALALPYADGYFDAAFSVDAYQYFGGDAAYMDKHLAPLIKPGGLIAIAVPGVKDRKSVG